MTISPITRPCDRALNPAKPGMNCCNSGVTNWRAKKPYTTVGTAASTSRMGFTTAVNLGDAYSLRYTAMVMPTGTARMQAMPVVNRVPDSNGRMPNCLFSNRGVQVVPVMNSTIDTSPKNRQVSANRTMMMPTVVTIDSKLHVNMTPCISFSVFRLLSAIRCCIFG